MEFRTDGGGLAFFADSKVALGSSTWNMKLSQIGRSNKKVVIVTHGLPEYDTYIPQIIGKRISGSNITIIAHKQCLRQAKWLLARYPDLKFILVDDVYAKMALIEPKTVWIGTGDFGKNTGLNASIGVHSEKVYDYCLKGLKHWIQTNPGFIKLSSRVTP